MARRSSSWLIGAEHILAVLEEEERERSFERSTEKKDVEEKKEKKESGEESERVFLILLFFLFLPLLAELVSQGPSS